MMNPMVKRKKSTLNKPQGMVYISSFGQFPTPWPCFNSFQVFFVSSSISASSTSTGAGEDDQPRFLSFLNIPMEVNKVHTIAHYNKPG